MMLAIKNPRRRKGASRKSLEQGIESLELRIAEHQAKIAADPNAREVTHWEMEIENFYEEIDRKGQQIQRRNPEAWGSEGERAECEWCGEEMTISAGSVIVECPACSARMAVAW